MRITVGVLVLGAALASARPARAQGDIVRHGFTLQLSLGGGGAYIVPDQGDSAHQGGLGGLNLMLGGFLSERTALAFKFVGVNFGPFDDRLSRDFGANIAGVGGPAAQYWLTDRVNLVGGFGFGVVDVKPRGGPDENRVGLGLLLGLNVLPLATAHHGLGWRSTSRRSSPERSRRSPIRSASAGSGTDLRGPRGSSKGELGSGAVELASLLQAQSECRDPFTAVSSSWASSWPLLRRQQAGRLS